MKLLSWNVNGYRAVVKKGFFDFVKKEKPGLLGLQESKVSPEQLGEKDYRIPGYEAEFLPAERKGYSGVAVFYREKPLTVKKGLGIKKFDSEGRLLQLEYPGFYFLNGYFPNGGQGPERIRYKLDFYEAFLEHIEKLRRTGKPVVFCGDVNTAHNEIDLARPKENEKNTGFLRVERDWLDKITSLGWVDTFRHFDKKPGNYTWWDYKTGARERNVGWRIDYFFLDREHLGVLKKAFILPEVRGSDHCPLGIEIKLS